MTDVRLTPTAPAAGLLPRTIGGLSLEETMGQITSVAPLRGQSGALKSALGGWPAPGRATKSLLWAGRDLVFVLGDCPDLAGMAATTDQSDAWAHLILKGAGAEEVLARLCPLDLATLKRGDTARSLLGHMNALYWRSGANTFEIFVFRSMAGTAVHELTRAMAGVTARQALTVS